MRLIIDTNVIIDVLLQRPQLFEGSKKVLEKCLRGEIEGFITASMATDIFYIIRKALKNNDEAYAALGHILDIVGIIGVSEKNVYDAYRTKAGDFEDCLLAVCAKENGIGTIVTRNAKDFEGFDITIQTPEQLV